MTYSRRHFLHHCGSGALGAASLVFGIERFGMINALAQSPSSDYKALVCIFLLGGNDGNNTIVPLETAEYNAYSSVRAPAGLAIPQLSLLPITPPSINRQFGLHPNLTGLHTLWNTGKLAVLSNVGPLVQPLNKAQYLAGMSRPYQLFSHSDQVNQWQTSVSDRPAQIGWGARTAAITAGFNGSAPLPTIVSMAGTSLFTIGEKTQPLAIAPAPVGLDEVLALNLSGSASDAGARRSVLESLLQMSSNQTLTRSAKDTMVQSLNTSRALNIDPTLATKFPTTSLGNQLQQVAKLISLRATFGIKRQIYFCALGGFDTHANQLGIHGDRLRDVSTAMKAFYDSTIELGVSEQVTTFTLSDFGRTLEPSGSSRAVGSDHAWGNHHLIMGGAVRGGDFYGTTGANGTVFPTLALDGPDDTDGRGRWIPTTSVDQYAATLARWYGLPEADVAGVFPYINRFTTSNLGFMSA